MKILIIIPSLGYGGAEKLVIDWIRNWLAADSVSAVTLVLYSQKYLERLGDTARDPKFRLRLELTNTPWRMFRFRYFLHLWRLRKIIREEAPDVVHTNLVSGLDMAILHRFLPRVKAFLHTVHNVARNDLGGDKYRELMRRMQRDPRCRLVAISPSVRRSIKEYYGCDALLICNGVAAALPTPAEAAVATELRGLAEGSGTGERRKIFLAVGRVMPQKNYEMLTAAFRNLQRELPVSLVVLGSFVSDADRMKYEAMSGEHIHFLGAKDNVGDYMRHADFFCMASLFEGFGLVVAEAMSAELIPVVTPTVGITDIVTDGWNGIVAESMEQRDFERAVRRALKLTETEKDEIVKHNRELYEERYRIENCAASYLDEFSKVLGIKSLAGRS
jgi:glycosyltransferase involved in cell wall biosynthesis